MNPQSPPKPQNNTDRVEALSILPVFLDLHDKHVVVIGGEGPAIWKAELLAQAGAKVEMICKATNADLLAFISNFKSSAAIKLTLSDWRKCDLSEAAVIIADVSEDEAAEFFQDAKRHTSLVNVIDKPAYCTFQFGSIVNRSPLVIGISTSGAAPVLAQHVRSLLEATLPADIQSLVNRAARIRTRVNETIGASNKRRNYWSAFFGKAFGFRTKPKSELAQPYLIKIVGIDDLTLRDIRAMQTADKIYFHADCNLQILQFGRREAQRIEIAMGAEFPQFSDLNCNIVLLSSFKERFGDQVQ